MNFHQLIIVRRGHITILGHDQEPTVCSQAYACHPDQGAYSIQVPKTKTAEYVIITYRMLPDGNTWTLQGQLTTLSEIKIHIADVDNGKYPPQLKSHTKPRN
ncbi:hypothetical protein QFZ81_007244 [Paenibacillus sp. V4I9]|nr:hypothetical protein [Paenibacillus sp. V4I9]